MKKFVKSTTSTSAQSEIFASKSNTDRANNLYKSLQDILQLYEELDENYDMSDLQMPRKRNHVKQVMEELYEVANTTGLTIL